MTTYKPYRSDDWNSDEAYDLEYNLSNYNEVDHSVMEADWTAKSGARLDALRETKKQLKPHRLNAWRRLFYSAACFSANSARISSVCSPCIGAGRRTAPGVPRNLMCTPSVFVLPALGWSTSATMSRACVCGSL